MWAGRVNAYSRIVMFVGVILLTAGVTFGHRIGAWAGVAIVGIAFAANTAAKLAHYRTLEIPVPHRVVVMGTWTLLAVTVVALLVDFTRSRLTDADGFVLQLAIAGFGFALLYRAFQARYLPHTDTDGGHAEPDGG